MTNQEILTKAIKLAVAGGFNFDHWRRRNRLVEGEKPNGDIETALIFNHDFAKALWGEDMFVDGKQIITGHLKADGVRIVWRGWQHHIQQMVVADDPIKYLGENI